MKKIKSNKPKTIEEIIRYLAKSKKKNSFDPVINTLLDFAKTLQVQEKTFNETNKRLKTFLDKVSSMAHLDFGKKLPLKNDDSGLDNLAASINKLAEELRYNMVSKKELENQKVLLESIVENIPVALYLKDSRDNFKISLWNKASERIFDTPKKKALNKTSFDLWPPEKAKQDLKENQGVIRKGQLYDNPDDDFTDKKGNKTYLHTRKIPVHLANEKKANYLLGISHNVTIRKLSQLSLHSEKEFSEQVINSLPGSFYMINTQGRFVRWNKQLEIITGYSSREITKMSPIEFFEKTDHETITQKITEVFQKGYASTEANIVAKDGHKISFYFTGNRAIIDNEAYLVGMGIDISERREIEQKLKNSESRFRALFEDAGDYIIIASFEQGEVPVIIDANNTALKMHGYTRDEFIGKKISHIIVPSERGKLKSRGMPLFGKQNMSVKTAVLSRWKFRRA